MLTGCEIIVSVRVEIVFFFREKVTLLIKIVQVFDAT